MYKYFKKNLKIKNIILIYFKIKNIFKKNNLTLKHLFNILQPDTGGIIKVFRHINRRCHY